MVTTGRHPYRQNLYGPVLSCLSGLTLLVLLNGCAAVHTSIAKANLDVQTRMSDAIFLDPVSPDKRTIFIQVRNTSDKPNFDIVQPIKAAIVAKGYRITEDPDQAHFTLQAQVLSVTKTDPSAAEAALNAGYGGVLGGMATGATIGAAVDGWRGAGIGAGAGAIAGGLASTVANAMVKDVTYVAITDVQLSQKTKHGVTGTQQTFVDNAQGTSAQVKQTFDETVNQKRYRTRVMSTANQVNLDYEDAAPKLTAGLTRVLAGLF